MNVMTFVLALPIFFVVYGAMGLLLERRRPDRQASWRRTTDGSSPLGRSTRAWFERTGHLSVNRFILRNQGLKTQLEKRLLHSGNPMGWSIETLLVVKELGALVALFLVWHNDLTNPIYWAGAAYVGFKLPDFYLNIKISQRKIQIQRQLPGFIDLLALTMEGGMDLLSATEKIIEKMKDNALKSEFFSLIQENRLGTSRKDSFKHMAERVNLPDMDSMSSMIIQSEELGTSLTNVLRNYAEDMRSKRILRAEEMAGKAPVKMLLPMMVFFFPIIFIIIFGPLALNLWSNH